MWGCFDNYNQIKQKELADGDEWNRCLKSFDDLDCSLKNNDPTCLKFQKCLKEEEEDFQMQMAGSAILRTFEQSNILLVPLIVGAFLLALNGRL